MGNRHPSIAPYETLHAADGPFVVAVGNDAQFATFAAALGVPELADDERFATNAARVTNRDELVHALEAALRERARRPLDRGARRRGHPVRDGQPG